jgi:NADH dehydrogenase
MILVTGGTGFIGQALIRGLVEMGYPVRTLVRPSRRSPNLPRSVSVEVTVSSLTDVRGLRAAMIGVDTVYHLASAEWKGPRASLMNTDIQGTRSVVEAAVDAGVRRIFYISHLGADRASAYPVLKAKAIAEEFVRRSGIDYTILRSAIVFGPNDSFTTGLAAIAGALPFFFLRPGSGDALLQPLWIDDLVTCLTWALDDPETLNHMYEVGGPEYFTFNQILGLVFGKLGVRRSLINVRPPYLRALTVLFESFFPNLPISVYWLDYLAANRTCALDTIPRTFNLMPARFAHNLDYLKGRNWRAAFFRSLVRPI